jgi:hypothetical protein
VSASIDDQARVRTARGIENVVTTLVDPVKPGELVLVHAGMAISRVCDEDAGAAGIGGAAPSGRVCDEDAGAAGIGGAAPSGRVCDEDAGAAGIGGAAPSGRVCDEEQEGVS